ncbi:MAG: hypothetical protein ACLGI5_17420 [Thermoleophilia bacterium]
MNHLQALDSPLVCLGHLSDDSVAVSIYVLVRHGAERRPDLAAALRGRVRMRFADGYSPVRIDFRGDEVEIADEGADGDRPYDLELSGRLGDVSALIAAPLAAGLPNPTSRHGRRAIARLADGRVDIDGPLGLARNLLRLLAVDAPTVATPSQTGELQRT